jgi:hypothetical protein
MRHLQKAQPKRDGNGPREFVDIESEEEEKFPEARAGEFLEPKRLATKDRVGG